MNISTYYQRHSHAGLLVLARNACTSVGYLRKLIYMRALPSIDMAKRLVDASGGELTLEGLANPIQHPVGVMTRGGGRAAVASAVTA